MSYLIPILMNAQIQILFDQLPCHGQLAAAFTAFTDAAHRGIRFTEVRT